MRSTKLTAFLFIVVLVSCGKDNLSKGETSYVKNGLPVTASQSIPALPTAGSGTLDVEYTPVNKTLNYKLTWSNLTDSVIAIRINGPAPAGYNSINLAFNPPTNPPPANFTLPSTTPHLVVQEFVGTTVKSLYGKSGSITNSLYIDGVKVTRENLEAGLYYFTIHTKTILPSPATPPTSLVYRWVGELRGQIVVQ